MPLPQSWGGCQWFEPVIQAPSSSAIVMDAAIAPNDCALAKADTSAGTLHFLLLHHYYIIISYYQFIIITYYYNIIIT